MSSYWHLAMNVEAYQLAVNKKDFIRLEFLFRINSDKWDFLDRMKESVALKNYLSYFDHFCIQQNERGVNALKQFTNYEERMPINKFISWQQTQPWINEVVKPELKERW